jgi:hypothetical protein
MLAQLLTNMRVCQAAITRSRTAIDAGRNSPSLSTRWLRTTSVFMRFRPPVA